MNKKSIFRRGALALLVATTVLVGCSKDNNSNPDPNNPQGTPYMIFTTDKKAGSEITLTINAKEADKKDVWVDLNNNGVYDSGTDVRLSATTAKYRLQGDTVRVYGKVTTFYCNDNEVTSLDVTRNTVLERLNMSHNKIKEVNLHNNTELVYLKVSALPLESLDLTTNKKLKELRFNLTFSGEKLKKIVSTMHENGGGTVYMNPRITNNEKEKQTMQTLKNKKWTIGHCE
ncbi:hypothetical protein HMPREF1977_1485 [Capnocytophaga ochracea F0287]|uniref:Uncharacterized protein n=1 Tax=Capnocytophaga ochracea F0287 TaxID=873517 RepID=E4MSX5_CAPOC|nr:hypothetical protein [Capnocytophaga ochracea]EFS97281.1 hypothetical protein HMPREF1977_1485 [Capnocytophaga ochracea F0287]EJF43707.1 hypothetical protein HMPREF1319_0403 [Capnocytophaga ochracea str. Holt 25]UEB44436.1 hypothetical protein LK419_05445 [Capnocytophaga ochracea]